MNLTSSDLKINMAGQARKKNRRINDKKRNASKIRKDRTLKFNGPLIPMGVIELEDEDGLVDAILCTDNLYANFYYAVSGEDGSFVPIDRKVTFKNGLSSHSPSHCSAFRFAYTGNYVVTYIYANRGLTKQKSKTVKPTQCYRVVAVSSDMYKWKVVSQVPLDYPIYGDELRHSDIARIGSVVVSDYALKKYGFMYSNETFISAVKSKDWKEFVPADQFLATTRLHMFDSDEMRLIGSFSTERGVALVYDSRKFEKPNDTLNSKYTINVGAMLFDIDNPYRLIWRSEQPLLKTEQTFTSSDKCTPLGLTTGDESISIYWTFEDGSIMVGEIKNFGKINHLPHPDGLDISRHHANPIIAPSPLSHWEAIGTFNPAAVKDDEERVHLLYRAIGADGLSRIGHTSSRDGKHFYKRSEHPVFNLQTEDVTPRKSEPAEYNPNVYTSGGGWGGCEDPRAVRIGNRVYMMYTAFQGWHNVRMAITSISLDDLKKERWHWSFPQYMSAPNEVHKNWVLFPEKINGKYAVLHSLSPKVMIDYVDDLKHPAKNGYIKSKKPSGGRPGHWDNWMRGTATPPIKTKNGWLVLYHAMDRRDPDKYKLGALLLDLKNPTKITHRSPSPILNPDMCYENDSKPGVVYATGAVVKDDDLYIYYGGGDRHVCLAHTPLQQLIEWLVDYGKI